MEMRTLAPSLGFLDRYPILAARTEVHLNPDGGTLFVDGAPIPLRRREADLLARCDGTQRLRAVLPVPEAPADDDLALAMLAASMVRAGRMELHEAPATRAIRVTGSRTAYIPPHLIIELTAGCNLRCHHCYRDSSPEVHDFMPTERLLAILDDLHRAGLRSLEITGGEPLYHPEQERILDFCLGRFEMVGILTNGTLVTERIAERLGRADAEQVLISVSIDASTEAEHDRRRGVPGAFRRATEAVARLARHGVKVRVSMSVDQENFGDLETTLLLAKSLGAIAFSYTPVLPLGRGSQWAAPGWALDAREVLRVETALRERYAGFLGVLPAETTCELEETGCGAGHRTFAMDPFGDVRPCATFAPGELSFGNLQVDSIEKVFGNPLAVAMSRLPSPSARVCGDCPLTYFCRHCALRGLRGAENVPDCAWSRLPAVQEVRSAWRKTAGPAQFKTGVPPR